MLSFAWGRVTQPSNLIVFQLTDDDKNLWQYATLHFLTSQAGIILYSYHLAMCEMLSQYRHG